MFPLAAIATLVGVGLNAYGSYEKEQGAKQQAADQQNITHDEMQVESQKQQAMELDAKRRQLEIVRNQQKARAIALTTATAQGAQFGSGLQGAYGQISAQGGVQALGINQNLEIGRNIFGFNKDIGNNKINMAQAGAQIAEGQAWSSLGSSISGASGAITGLSGGFNPASGGSPQGYGSFVSGLGSAGGGGLY